MKKIGASLFVGFLVSAAVAQTNAPGTRAMSLQDCLVEALKHNFDVRVERYEPVKSLLNLNAAYAGYDPTLSLSGTHNFNDQPSGALDQYQRAIPGTTSDQNAFDSGINGLLPWGLQYNFSGNISEQYGSSALIPFDNSGGTIGVTLSQPLLKNFWIDTTRLGVTAAKNQIKQSEQGLRQQLITTVTAVENAFYELIYARENVKVQLEALNLAQTQLDEDNERVQIKVVAERGGTIEQDEAQVAQSRANLIAAQFTLASDENTMKNLISDNYQQWHGVDIEPAATLEAVRQLFDVQDSWSKGLAARPDFLQAKLTLEQQGIQLKFDLNQIFPQLNLTGSYGFNGADKEFSGTFAEFNQGNAPFYTYGAQLSMPLDNLKARETFKSDKAVQQQDLLRLKQLEQNVMVQIDNAVKQAQSAWESVDATKSQRIYAEAALDAEQKKYAVGKSTTFTVLQLQSNLTSARSQEIRALANYNEALSNLAQQEGTTLERRNLDVTVK